MSGNSDTCINDGCTGVRAVRGVRMGLGPWNITDICITNLQPDRWLDSTSNISVCRLGLTSHSGPQDLG